MIVVVGSGAGGVHFALSLLKKGMAVTMVDVGYQGPEPIAPESTLNELKETLEDPCEYFLGPRNEALFLPGDSDEYYGFPPNRQYIFKHVQDFSYAAEGFAPLFSFARGGLAQAWTGGCYPLNDDELAAFPFSYEEIEPHYAEIAERIGVGGAVDDLARFMPIHANLLPGLDLDAHSGTLLATYERHRAWFHGTLGCYNGRSRVATLSQSRQDREPCAYLGRCLWGCPLEALYTPSMTLRECMSFPQFTYIDGVEARFFRSDAARRVTSLVVRSLSGGGEHEIAVGTLVLAAGALSSAKIVMLSVLHGTGERIELRGLMDNRQVLVPFLNLRMLGHQFSADTYQYHLLGLAIEADDPRDYIHGQITTLKTALLHPFIQRLPFDLRTSTYVTRAFHGALGLVNVNFHDTRRADNYVTLDTQDHREPQLMIHYRPPADEATRIRRGMAKIKRALRKLGCLVPPGMAHVRPMGASVHYAGTIPMSASAERWTSDESCRSRDFENLFFVDGTTFPFLPAKNLTFTLMANAVRVAETAF